MNGLETRVKVLGSVIRPLMQNHVLNTFQDFAFTYFKIGTAISMELSTCKTSLECPPGLQVNSYIDIAVPV